MVAIGGSSLIFALLSFIAAYQAGECGYDDLALIYIILGCAGLYGADKCFDGAMNISKSQTNASSNSTTLVDNSMIENANRRGNKGDRGSVDIIQYEKLKSQYAADEICNAERIGSALKDDPSHRAASYLSKEQIANGRTYSFTGGDKKSYTLLQTKGQLDGVDGIFEYITNEAGQVAHQRFIKGGIYTGFPNQAIPKGGY